VREQVAEQDGVHLVPQSRALPDDAHPGEKPWRRRANVRSAWVKYALGMGFLVLAVLKGPAPGDPTARSDCEAEKPAALQAKTPQGSRVGLSVSSVFSPRKRFVPAWSTHSTTARVQAERFSWYGGRQISCSHSQSSTRYRQSQVRSPRAG
jgi:hypothetical protein